MRKWDTQIPKSKPVWYSTAIHWHWDKWTQINTKQTYKHTKKSLTAHKKMYTRVFIIGCRYSCIKAWHQHHLNILCLSRSKFIFTRRLFLTLVLCNVYLISFHWQNYENERGSETYPIKSTRVEKNVVAQLRFSTVNSKCQQHQSFMNLDQFHFNEKEQKKPNFFFSIKKMYI